MDLMVAGWLGEEGWGSGVLVSVEDRSWFEMAGMAVERGFGIGTGEGGGDKRLVVVQV